MSPASLYTPLLVLGALVLHILVSTAPIIPSLDITARTQFDGTQVFDNSQGLTEIRFGIWAPCKYDAQGRSCLQNSPGYSFVVTGEDNSTAEINASLTLALVLHPIAGAVSVSASFFTIIPKYQITVVASVFVQLAALVTLLAFVIDIVFWVIVGKTMENLGPRVTTSMTGPGLWMTLASFGLLAFASVAIEAERRRGQDRAKKDDQLMMEVAPLAWTTEGQGPQ